MVPTGDPSALSADSGVRSWRTKRWAGRCRPTWTPGRRGAGPAPPRAFGPAAAADVQAWSGRTGLKDVLERLEPRLAVFRDERRRTLFDLPGAPRPEEDVPAPPPACCPSSTARPGPHDRSRVVPDEHRSKLETKNLRIPATFLVDGVVAGTGRWSAGRRDDHARLAPFGRLAATPARALKAEGEALLRFTKATRRVAGHRWSGRRRGPRLQGRAPMNPARRSWHSRPHAPSAPRPAFLAGAPALAVHVVDDSFVQPQPGTSATDHLSAASSRSALLALAAWASRGSGAGARGALALTLVPGRS